MPKSKEEFITSLLNYLETHKRYDELNKREVSEALLNVLINDIGAANDFLQVIGVDIDLYTYKLLKEETEKGFICYNPECPNAGKCNGECANNF